MHTAKSGNYLNACSQVRVADRFIDMRVIARLSIFVVSLLLALHATAADPTDSLREKAEKGDAIAQFNLGLVYVKGRGVPKDEAEAVKWFRKAADQGDAQAQFNLGVTYAKGRGVLGRL